MSQVLFNNQNRTPFVQQLHQGSATDMHQLAVVGGGRNANGVPGVFGPADGRGQSCMDLCAKYSYLNFLCVFFGPEKVDNPVFHSPSPT